MPGACLSLWPSEACEWSTWDIWRSPDVVVRAIYLSPALMLGYTFFVLIRFLLRYKRARIESQDFGSTSSTDHLRNRKKLIAGLSQGLGTVKAIASTAPFLGLAGTAYGTLCKLFFGDVVMEHDHFVAWISSQIAFALVAAAAGLVAAVPAALVHNALRTRTERIQSRLANPAPYRDRNLESFQRAQRLPLRRRFSDLPPFAMIGAPVLAGTVCLFLTLEPHVSPTGLPVALPSTPCNDRQSRRGVSSRTIVLRITNSGETFINQEPIPANDVQTRLSAIYRPRARRELYLRAEGEVPFQAVAEAIDIARNSTGANSPDVSIYLITPQAEAESERCFALALNRARRGLLRK